MTEPISLESPLLQRLNAFVGKWRSSATGPWDPNVIGGQSSFEWFKPDEFKGNYFLAQYFTMDNSNFPRGLFIMAVDNDRENYVVHYFDSRGTFSDDGKTITGQWEIAMDGKTWEHDFDLNYTKV
jgi:hypothetical protein